MTHADCPREQDLLDALEARRWPSRCDDELRQHVASCAACADLLAVAAALLDEGQNDAVPPVPPASVVWWRAQLRAREDAARAAARPLGLAFRVGFAVLAAAVIVGVVAIAPAVRSWAAVAWSALPVPATPDIDLPSARAAVLDAVANRGIQLAAAAWLVLGPVALYLALTDD